MKRFATAMLIWAILPPALAQAPGKPPLSENVIVTAPKIAPDDIIRGYVKSYAAPAPALGRIARWRYGICPVTTGLPAGENAFVTARVREIAALAGAPVRGKDCHSNIDIVFTFNPQVLLDGLRDSKPVLLGYHNDAEAERMAQMSHPVQAWYTTETADLIGHTNLDHKNMSGIASVQTSFPGGDVQMPDIPVAQSTGTRLNDGLTSEFYHVIIVADLAKVGSGEIGPIADYIAMLALSQTDDFAACLPVPSIVNLLTPDCDGARKPTGVTDADLAYLRGLYRMNRTGTLQQQQGSIAYEMKKNLENR